MTIYLQKRNYLNRNGSLDGFDEWKETKINLWTVKWLKWFYDDETDNMDMVNYNCQTVSACPIKRRTDESIDCGCGGHYIPKSEWRHKRSQRHMKWIKQQ